jgi:hypothetical protein
MATGLFSPKKGGPWAQKSPAEQGLLGGARKIRQPSFCFWIFSFWQPFWWLSVLLRLVWQPVLQRVRRRAQSLGPQRVPLVRQGL